MIPEFKNGINNNKKINGEQSKQIKTLKDEMNDKDKKIEAIQFVLHEQNKILTNKERLLRKQKNQEISNYERAKRELQQIEDEIKHQKYLYSDLEEDSNKVDKQIAKKKEKRKEYVKDIMENLDIENEEIVLIMDNNNQTGNNNNNNQ